MYAGNSGAIDKIDDIMEAMYLYIVIFWSWKNKSNIIQVNIKWYKEILIPQIKTPLIFLVILSEIYFYRLF